MGRDNKFKLEEWEFTWRGRKYMAIGKWEINWIKWAMRHNPKALDKFIEKEVRKAEEFRGEMGR